MATFLRISLAFERSDMQSSEIANFYVNGERPHAFKTWGIDMNSVKAV